MQYGLYLITNPGVRRYSVRVWYRTTDDTVIGWNSNEIDVTWSNT